jgi:hypothetical protein
VIVRIRTRLITVAVTVTLTVAVLFLTSGCANGVFAADRQRVSVHDTVQQLQGRPDILQVMKADNLLLKQIRSEFTKAGYTGRWTPIEDVDVASCASSFGDQAAGLNAEQRVTTRWASSGISERRWPPALASLQRLSRTAGFTRTQVINNRPGEHEVLIGGSYGAGLEFGSRGRMSVLSIRTGCHRLANVPVVPPPPSTATPTTTPPSAATQSTTAPSDHDSA